MAEIIPLFGTVSSTSVFYGFILPWIFTFAIVYGLLTAFPRFGSASSRVNVALSFVIAFFVTGVAGPTLAEFFITIFGGASFILAGILVIILFLALLGYTDVKAKWAAGAVILIGIILFLVSSGTVLGSGSIFLDTATASTIFWIVIIIIAAYLIVRGSGDGEPAPAEGGGFKEPKKE